MKLLFIARHFTYFRNFDSVIARLAERGHAIHLAADGEEALGGRELVERLAARFPAQVTVGFTPDQAGPRRRLTLSLRLGLDYLRYTDPVYESTPAIRARARERTPAFALALGRLPGRRLASRAIEALEHAAAEPAAVEAFIAGQRPDVLLITPLIGLGSPQLDYVRAARRLGIRNALCVWSWDHLSSKSLIRVAPDAVIVWNETQRREAQRFHGIDPSRVVVTGAQCFDRWFDRQPSRDREAFCRRVGLPADRPFVLWVCSALFRGSPSEADFVRRWIAALRASPDARVRGASVLVRPHPQRAREWTDARWIRETPGVALWGDNPMDEASRADYFDSMYHSAAVVGLNTSALVEAAVVDRPVYTILAPEFAENQEGTFHFKYLLTVGEGFLRTSRTLEDHASQLAAAFDAPADANRRFVAEFIRPHAGIPATDAFVHAVESMAAAPPPSPVAPPAWLPALRPVAAGLARAAETAWAGPAFWSPARQSEEAARAAMIEGRRRKRLAEERSRRARATGKVARTIVHEARLGTASLSRRLRKQRQRLVVRVKTTARTVLVAAGLLKHSS